MGEKSLHRPCTAGRFRPGDAGQFWYRLAEWNHHRLWGKAPTVPFSSGGSLSCCGAKPCRTVALQHPSRLTPSRGVVIPHLCSLRAVSRLAISLMLIKWRRSKEEPLMCIFKLLSRKIDYTGATPGPTGSRESTLKPGRAERLYCQPPTWTCSPWLCSGLTSTGLTGNLLFY